jgi:hypothetical protein
MKAEGEVDTTVFDMVLDTILSGISYPATVPAIYLFTEGMARIGKDPGVGAGVEGLSPPGYGIEFLSVYDFQDRDYTWQEGLYGPQRKYFALGNELESFRNAQQSIIGALPYLQCYLERCD